jgi:hypothetical protein
VAHTKVRRRRSCRAAPALSDTARLTACLLLRVRVRSHPDPKSTTLQLLAAVLEKFVAFRGFTLAVFLDFCSLYQKDADGKRTASEQRLFDIGLKGNPCISELYSHPQTFILKVTSLPDGYPDGFDFSIPDGTEGTPNLASYYDRGWCFCEASMGDLVKASNFSLDLGKFPSVVYKKDYDGRQEEMDLVRVLDTCAAGRPPPPVPARFRVLLEDKSFTSKKADIETVASLSKGAFEPRMGKAVQLQYSGLGWTDEDAKLLGEALGVARSLKKLYLSGNDFTDEGVKTLAAALRNGKAPKLKEIYLWQGNQMALDAGNRFSSAATQELRDARKGLYVEDAPASWSR